MKYKYIGKTGLRVTPICLGTMSFGSWSDEKESFKIMDKSVDFGINFFDTAELYPVPPKTSWAGETETIIGKWLSIHRLIAAASITFNFFLNLRNITKIRHQCA